MMDVLAGSQVRLRQHTVVMGDNIRSGVSLLDTILYLRSLDLHYNLGKLGDATLMRVYGPNDVLELEFYGE